MGHAVRGDCSSQAGALPEVGRLERERKAGYRKRDLRAKSSTGSRCQLEQLGEGGPRMRARSPRPSWAKPSPNSVSASNE